MASTSAIELSSAMEETRNWLEMPDEIMGGMILQRLGALEILESAQKVCTTWRRICKDPVMWKVIHMSHRFDGYTDYDFEQLIKQAVHRSCGELIDISLKWFATDDLLYFISRCSSKLNRLHLTNCSGVTDYGLNNALKRLPHLETLKLSCMSINAEDIEDIGRNCPQLKSFKMKTEILDTDGDAYAIGNTMPALRHLKLVGSPMDNDDQVQAILNGCPHLESLDLRGCSYLLLDENLEKVCRERIKDFKFKRNNIPKGYVEFHLDFNWYDDIDDFHDGIQMALSDDDDDDDGTVIFLEDEYDG